MLNADTLIAAMRAVSGTMSVNRDALIELDQRNGDGDLGISMDEGFAAACRSLEAAEDKDLGRLMIAAGKAFNEAAPSSLGTILSFFMMGMARVLKGSETADAALTGEAMAAGVDKIMERAGSKPGEKTVLDALDPAVKALRAHAPEGFSSAFAAAHAAAREGAESTKAMKAVHGRAAYYGDKAIGLIDGGAVAGMLLFQALAACAAGR